MNTYLNFLNELSNKVVEEHSHHEKPVNWVNPYRAQDHEETRNQLITKAGSRLNWDFKNTKPWINSLSRGCQLCGQGEWSCLFITGRCNASCFYCPARQDQEDLPQTQRLRFHEPRAYAEYINQFGFQAVAFSGGEPLMVLDRTLEYLRTLREKCDPCLYIWLYTNGILGSEQSFRVLAQAGLNEIRFDLGATHYNPKVLKVASHHIEHVTVEIPSVPEEVARLKQLLPLLHEYGVTNLNLHQLRLTAYNASRMLSHDYTYLHGEQPMVLESELTAFEIIDFVLGQNIPIGVNYCNFQFKNRFQKAGFRRKMAGQLAHAGEEITENGFLRKIIAETAGVQTPVGIQELRNLCLHPDRVTLYYRGRVLENLDATGSGQHFLIACTDYLIQDGLSVQPLVIEKEMIGEFLSMLDTCRNIIPGNQILFDAWRQEFIEEGMRDYF